MRTLTLALVLCCIGKLAAAKDDDALEKDRTLLQGAWTLVAAEDAGEPRPESEIKDARYVFLRNKILEMTGDKVDFEMEYELEPTSNPKRINEYFRIETPGKPPREMMIRGIYRIEGDTLTLCTRSSPRPTSFSSKEKDTVLLVLKREQAKPGSDEE